MTWKGGFGKVGWKIDRIVSFEVTLESESGSCTKRIALGPARLQLAGLQSLVVTAFRLPLGTQMIILILDGEDCILLLFHPSWLDSVLRISQLILAIPDSFLLFFYCGRAISSMISARLEHLLMIWNRASDNSLLSGGGNIFTS